ncbi:hypothetical protein OIU84_003224 [Salix udensis]|uniref:Uncharacterized protein n=1 Tax=Salix udensis TaxID=889485 RepID=A0AAD6P637_9ROSI|nr:hypothetical protein OIU84_003224 [Salix udensis]
MIEKDEKPLIEVNDLAPQSDIKIERVGAVKIDTRIERVSAYHKVSVGVLSKTSGNAEESWMYWSLKTKKVPAPAASGDVSERMSPDYFLNCVWGLVKKDVP